MQISEHGNVCKTKCPKCETVFKFTNKDVKRQIGFMSDGEFVECPSCSYDITIKVDKK